MPDKIILKDMDFYAYHGVLPAERELGQRFQVTVIMFCSLQQAGRSDLLAETPDYSVIYREVQKIVEGRRFNLLEALAEAIAARLLALGARAVQVKVKKMHPPLPGRMAYAAVEVARGRFDCQVSVEEDPGQPETPEEGPGLPVTVYLGLGSNIGDKDANLQRAVDLFDAHPAIEVKGISPFLETAPVGYLEQPNFLNGVVQAATTLTPRELLAAIQSIENELGRIRTIRWGPRTIDIDILLYGDLILESADLTIPHPRMLERAFVLQPLAALAPELRIPGCPDTVSALAQKIQY